MFTPCGKLCLLLVGSYVYSLWEVMFTPCGKLCLLLVGSYVYSLWEVMFTPWEVMFTPCGKLCLLLVGSYVYSLWEVMFTPCGKLCSKATNRMEQFPKPHPTAHIVLSENVFISSKQTPMFFCR